MPCQHDLPEPSFPQFLDRLILPKTWSRIKILPIGRIEYSFIFNKLEIILKVFSTFWIKESKMREF